MKETRRDRAGLIAQLANLSPQPESVPMNSLVKVEGAPLDDADALDWTRFVRTIAVARLTLPHSYIRLSAGRRDMPEAVRALCASWPGPIRFLRRQAADHQQPRSGPRPRADGKLDLLPL